MTIGLQVQNFASMYGEVGRLVQDTSTTRKTAIKDCLNRALAEAAEMFEWPQLLRADESGTRYATDTTLHTFEASDAYAVAPAGCGRIKALINQTAGGAPLEIVSPEELYGKAGSMLNTAGIPMLAAIVGRTAQYAPFASTGTPQLSCGSDANDNIKSVRIYFRETAVQPGQLAWTDVTGTFSTSVLVTNADVPAGYQIEAVGVPVGWVGDVNLLDRVGNQVGVIPSLEHPNTNVNSTLNIVSRPLLRLWPVPDADYSATWIWWRVPLRLTEDEDIPEIPVSSFLVAKAAAEIFSQMGKDAKAQMWESRAGTYLKMASGQNTGTKRVQAVPYMGNVVAQTGSGPRWSQRY